MRRAARRFLLLALALQALPITGSLLLSSRATGPPPVLPGGPLRTVETAVFTRVPATPRAGEGRLAVPEARPHTVPLPPAAAERASTIMLGSSRSKQNIAMPPMPVLSGRVIAANGRSGAGVVLLLNHADALHRTSIYSEATEDGTFVIEAEIGKTYHLVALPPVGLPNHVKLAMGAAYVLDLIVPAADLEVRMMPAHTISGTVCDGAGVPSRWTRLSVADHVVGALNWGTTDDEGLFELQVPPCSKVNVSAWDESLFGGSFCDPGVWRTVKDVPSNGPRLTIDLAAWR